MLHPVSSACLPHSSSNRDQPLQQRRLGHLCSHLQVEHCHTDGQHECHDVSGTGWIGGQHGAGAKRCHMPL